MSDTYFANVGLLLHCNGIDASTSFPDSSTSAHTVTAVGNAQVDTAQSKWGGASAYFDGVDTDRLTVPFASSFDLSTGDFTVECWVRFEQAADSWSDSVIMRQPGNSGLDQWLLLAQAPGGPYYEIAFLAVNTSNSQVISIVHSAELYENIWYHIAVTRSGSTFRVFVDGASPASGSSSATLKSTTAALSIGDVHWGWVDDVRVTKGVARYTAAFTPPAAEFEEGGLSVYIAAPSPLGAPALLVSAGKYNIRASAPSPLGAAALLGFTDWTARLQEVQLTQFALDLVTPDGDVRVPISSWQATLTTTGQCYAGCVIPACLDWVEDLEEATEFVILRRAVLDSGAIVMWVEMIRCPLDTLQIDQGPTNMTASLSGYFDEIAEDDDPPARYDRTLEGVRSVSTNSGARVRCAIDWLLRPGQRAFYASTSLIVDYINFYATISESGEGMQAYMDVGERV